MLYGTLLTSGILFPLISKFKNIKQWIKDVFKCFVAFVVTLILSGQISQLFTLTSRAKDMNSWIGKIPIEDKFMQFSIFIKSIFFSPTSEIAQIDSGASVYRMASPAGISIIGLIILALVFISFILNRKEKMAKISIAWVIFSVIVLFIIGWGTAENGLILYSLYFAWAYLVLIYMLIKKIFKNKIAFNIIFTCLIIVMAVLNFKELFSIITFAITNY